MEAAAASSGGRHGSVGPPDHKRSLSTGAVQALPATGQSVPAGPSPLGNSASPPADAPSPPESSAPARQPTASADPRQDPSFVSDPEYVRYYYANKNINPRLPPPRSGWGDLGKPDLGAVDTLSGQDAHAALNLLLGAQLSLAKDGGPCPLDRQGSGPPKLMGSWVDTPADVAAAGSFGPHAQALGAAPPPASVVDSLALGGAPGTSPPATHLAPDLAMGGLVPSTAGSPARTSLFNLTLAGEDGGLGAGSAPGGGGGGTSSATGSQPHTPSAGLLDAMLSSPRLGSEASEGPSSQDPQVALAGTLSGRRSLLQVGSTSLRMDRVPRSMEPSKLRLGQSRMVGDSMGGAAPDATPDADVGGAAAAATAATGLGDLLSVGAGAAAPFDVGGGVGGSSSGGGTSPPSGDVAGLLPGMGLDPQAVAAAAIGTNASAPAPGNQDMAAFLAAASGGGVPGGPANPVANTSMQQMQYMAAAMYPYYAQQAVQMQAAAAYPPPPPPMMPSGLMLPGMVVPGMIPGLQPGSADLAGASLRGAPLGGLPAMPPVQGFPPAPGAFATDPVAAYYSTMMAANAGGPGAVPPGLVTSPRVPEPGSLRGSSDGGLATSRSGGGARDHGGSVLGGTLERSPVRGSGGRGSGGGSSGAHHPHSPVGRTRERDGRARRNSGGRHGSGGDASHDSLLEEFKANKSKRFELPDIAGHVFEFSMDQHGSRFIQQRLESAPVEAVDAVLREVLPRVGQLMTDVFGNYVVQKLFDHGSDEHRLLLHQRGLVGSVLPLSLQMYGCRVVQKALEVLPIDVRCQLVAELDGHAMRCVRDQNGNHVIQKIIERVPMERMTGLLDSFLTCVVPLSSHPFGCRVIQRMLEHCHDEVRRAVVMEEILKAACQLSQDQYGNYVIQHVMERGSAPDRLRVVHMIVPEVVTLSMHKFASNVVEKCLANCDVAERDMLIRAMLEPGVGGGTPGGGGGSGGGAASEEALSQMMKDQFGNYVVQKVLEVCNDAQREQLLVRVRAQLAALKKYAYGKHIVTRVEKLLATGTRLQSMRAAAGHAVGAVAAGTSGQSPREVTVGPDGRFDTVSGSGLPYDSDIHVLQAKKAGPVSSPPAVHAAPAEDAAAPATPTRASALPSGADASPQHAAVGA